MEKKSNCSSLSAGPQQEEYVQSLESRLSERSNVLEEKHMEAAIDAELIHAPCCSVVACARHKDDRDSSTTDDDSSKKDNNSEEKNASNEREQKPIFDDYTNPDAVQNCLSPYVPTSAQRIAALVHFVQLQENDVLLDIGCGDGRVCIAASKLTGCRSIGLDVSPLCIQMAQQVALEEEREEAAAGRLLQGNVQFYQTDATVDPNVLLRSDNDNGEQMCIYIREIAKNQSKHFEFVSHLEYDSTAAINIVCFFSPLLCLSRRFFFVFTFPGSPIHDCCLPVYLSHAIA